MECPILGQPELDIAAKIFLLILIEGFDSEKNRDIEIAVIACAALDAGTVQVNR